MKIGFIFGQLSVVAFLLWTGSGDSKAAGTAERERTTSIPSEEDASEPLVAALNQVLVSARVINSFLDRRPEFDLSEAPSQADLAPIFDLDGTPEAIDAAPGASMPEAPSSMSVNAKPLLSEHQVHLIGINTPLIWRNESRMATGVAGLLNQPPQPLSGSPRLVGPPGPLARPSIELRPLSERNPNMGVATRSTATNAPPAPQSTTLSTSGVNGWTIVGFDDSVVFLKPQLGRPIGVRQGDQVPGVGRITNIRRQNDDIVITTEGGRIQNNP